MLEPPAKRRSFARARIEKKAKFEKKVNIADYVQSPSLWHEICTYFEEDELLRPFREELIQDHSMSAFGELLFKIWNIATEEQFSWFISCFESQMQEKHPKLFEEALEQFDSLCEAL